MTLSGHGVTPYAAWKQEAGSQGETRNNADLIRILIKGETRNMYNVKSRKSFLYSVDYSKKEQRDKASKMKGSRGISQAAK